MRFFRKPPPPSTTQGLSREEALKCIPVIHDAVQVSETESGEIILEYPLQFSPFLLAIFRRFQKNQPTPTKKLQLDTMGSSVWQNIDGKATTRNIIMKFVSGYGVSVEDAEKSVVAFLVDLGRRGIIAMKQHGEKR